MSNEENYNKVAELATGMARLITDRNQVTTLWLPFQLLYVEMAKRKEINTLVEIVKERALLYWTEASISRPEAPKYLKMWITQALYMFDMITEKLNL